MPITLFIFNRIILILSLFIFNNLSFAGLITESSRVIYLEQDISKVVNIKNINYYPVLVQSFIDDGAGDANLANAPFMVSPAVMRLNQNELNAITILYTGDNLPSNKESMFWLNLHEIPATNAKDDASNLHKIAITLNTQLKLLYRPASLKPELDIKYLANNIKFNLKLIKNNIHITANNLTPYNASIINIVLNNNEHLIISKQQDMTLKPFNNKTYIVENIKDASLINELNNNLNNTNITFYINDDYGNTHEFNTKANL